VCPCDEHPETDADHTDPELSSRKWSDSVRPNEGYFSTGDPEDDEDAAIMASIFMHHLHFLHEFSRCSVCESMSERQENND
jgi:hypothetical protein